MSSAGQEKAFFWLTLHTTLQDYTRMRSILFVMLLSVAAGRRGLPPNNNDRSQSSGYWGISVPHLDLSLPVEEVLAKDLDLAATQKVKTGT